MTRPHAGIETVEQLRAAGWERIVEIAAWAKTRVRTRGLRAGSDLGLVELQAMVIVLDFHLEDHPDVAGAEPARPSIDPPPEPVPDIKGFDL